MAAPPWKWDPGPRPFSWVHGPWLIEPEPEIEPMIYRVAWRGKTVTHAADKRSAKVSARKYARVIAQEYPARAREDQEYTYHQDRSTGTDG